MICPLHAWGDESIRSHGLDAPAYLLGASIVDTDDADDVRETLLLLRRHGRKLHWRDLDLRSRSRVVTTIAGTPTTHVVVAARPIELRRQERARAVCLERLAWELAERDVTELVLEARPRRLMDRDRHTVSALRGRRVIPPTLSIVHGEPSEEPLLWLPDQVLGAAGEALAGDDDFMRRLGPACTRVELWP